MVEQIVLKMDRCTSIWGENRTASYVLPRIENSLSSEDENINKLAKNEEIKNWYLEKKRKKE